MSATPTILDNNETNESNHGQADDKNIIDKILGEMKCQFNKTDRKSNNNNSNDDEKQEPDDNAGNDNKSSLNDDEDDDDDADDNDDDEDKKPDDLNNKTENSTNDDKDSDGGDVDDNNDDENSVKEEKPRIVLLFKKPNTEMSPSIKNNTTNNRRSLRNQKNPTINNCNNDKSNETILKRSTRRRSKDCTESILQSAIARKEKSYNESNNKPQRLTRQLKPTQKILENLEIAKQEKTKLRNNKVLTRNNNNNNNNESIETDERLNRKHKHRHNKKTTTKRLKNNTNNNDNSNNNSSKESDSDHSMELENRGNIAGFRRSRRISSRYKEDTSMDVTDDSIGTTNPLEETMNNNNNNDENSNDLILSKLCLCTQKTQYYVAPKQGETIYCSAIDTVGDKTLGCSRVIETSEIMMLRPSTRIPYSIYCESHKNRLLRHNCCPTCGIFCTQGRFVECESKHQYHKNCKLTIGNLECCPHCGITTTQYDVNITMHTIKKPIFLPMQKSQ